MNVRIDETGADDAIKISIYVSRAKLLYEPVPNADVTVQGLEIVSIDYGSLEQDLTRLRHLSPLGR
jgi:hypothetical protein